MNVEQPELWGAAGPLPAKGPSEQPTAPPPPHKAPRTPRRFRAVPAARERQLLEEGRHLARVDAERIQRRYGL